VRIADPCLPAVQVCFLEVVFVALIEISDEGRRKTVTRLPHLQEFEGVWFQLSEAERTAIEAEINRRLDDLVRSPDPNWGPITNTSVEGGRPNPTTGFTGDWRGTVFQPIYHVFNGDEVRAGMFYGNVWKKVIIDRDEQWCGIRPDPTFRRKGVSLMGKTYFLVSS